MVYDPIFGEDVDRAGAPPTSKSERLSVIELIEAGFVGPRPTSRELSVRRHSDRLHGTLTLLCARSYLIS